MYIYIYIHGERVDFCESEKMIEIYGKMDKSNTYNGFSNDIPFLFREELL